LSLLAGRSSSQVKEQIEQIMPATDLILVVQNEPQVTGERSE